MSQDLCGKRVLITGVGTRPVKKLFRDITSGKPSHVPVIIKGQEYKANIGAATAFECAKSGAIVHLVSRSQDKLNLVKKWILSFVPKAKVEFSVLDLNFKEDIYRLAQSMSSKPNLFWVQSVGVGGGTVELADGNPYLKIDDLNEKLIEAEMSVLKSTISLMQLLLPIFRSQEETRVCIVSSMSAVRSVWSASMHMAAKGAISRFTNAAMIELDPEKIFITDIRPGGCDTGLYDSEIVSSTIIQMSKTYGYDWSKGGPRLIPPSSVAKAILLALTSEAHITSINMVGRGQWPHEGS